MRKLSAYFFGVMVFTYMLTAVGLPVYLHYCGGQVEEVSYLIESNGCCGEEEPDNDCCRNEGMVVQYDADFTLKTFTTDFVITALDVPYLARQVAAPTGNDFPIRPDNGTVAHRWQNSLLTEITVLRI